jgi:hypothetical protein
LLGAEISLAAGRSGDAARELEAAALAGEHEALSLDRVSSLGIRWQYAEALFRLGQADSAARVWRALGAPRGLPPAHFALRGFVVRAAAMRAGRVR